jgi:hypothetical protein
MNTNLRIPMELDNSYMSKSQVRQRPTSEQQPLRMPSPVVRGDGQHGGDRDAGRYISTGQPARQ